MKVTTSKAYRGTDRRDEERRTVTFKSTIPWCGGGKYYCSSTRSLFMLISTLRTVVLNDRIARLSSVLARRSQLSRIRSSSRNVRESLTRPPKSVNIVLELHHNLCELINMRKNRENIVLRASNHSVGKASYVLGVYRSRVCASFPEPADRSLGKRRGFPPLSFPDAELS